jgi:hypothetical protein
MGFTLLMQGHIEKMLEFYEKHFDQSLYDRLPGWITTHDFNLTNDLMRDTEAPSSWCKRPIQSLLKTLALNFKARQQTEEAWAFLFLLLMSLPICSVVTLILMWFYDPAELRLAWFFLIYALHFLWQCGYVFHAAASVSDWSWKVRTSIVESIAGNRIRFAHEDASPLAVTAYLDHLRESYHAFRVLGVPITYSLGAKLAQACFAVILPLIVLRFQEVSSFW